MKRNELPFRYGGKMKVLVYLYYYPPYRYVGGELMTADLCEHLVRNGHVVDVYAEYVPEEYERNGVSIRNSGVLHKERASRYDVFLTHPEIRTMMWAHTKHLPYAAVVHNLNLTTTLSLQRQPPELTIANSYYTAARLPKEVRDSVAVIHPPVFEADRTTAGTKYTMVNFSPDKGGDVLNYLANKNPKLAFQAVAGGHGQQMWDQPKNVHQIKPTGDMDAVYADTKALLFPSKSETYGKVVSEAVMRGIPVIASDLPAIREAGGKAPVYLDPFDYEGWNDHIRALERPRTHERMVRASLERGDYLARRTKEDLDRWTGLMMQTAGHPVRDTR